MNLRNLALIVIANVAKWIFSSFFDVVYPTRDVHNEIKSVVIIVYK